MFSRPTWKKKSRFPASTDRPPNRRTVGSFSSQPPPSLYSVYMLPPSIPPFHLAHELLLHYLSIHLQPPTCHPHFFCANYHRRTITLSCPSTLVPGCWSTRDPRPPAAVLVCHKSVSGTSVIDGPRWAALTHPASGPRRGGVREHWLWCCMWQGWIKDELTVAGEDKRDHVMDEVLLVNVMRFDLRSIDHCRNFI